MFSLAAPHAEVDTPSLVRIRGPPNPERKGAAEGICSSGDDVHGYRDDCHADDVVEFQTALSS